MAAKARRAVAIRRVVSILRSLTPWCNREARSLTPALELGGKGEGTPGGVISAPESILGGTGREGQAVRGVVDVLKECVASAYVDRCRGRYRLGRFSGEADEMLTAEKTERCSCGEVLRPAARFCRRCGGDGHVEQSGDVRPADGKKVDSGRVLDAIGLFIWAGVLGLGGLGWVVLTARTGGWPIGLFAMMIAVVFALFGKYRLARGREN